MEYQFQHGATFIRAFWDTTLDLLLELRADAGGGSLDCQISVRQIIDADGNVTLAKSYEPYGSVLTSTDTATTANGEWNELNRAVRGFPNSVSSAVAIDDDGALASPLYPTSRTHLIDTFESHAGKKMSILHWGQPWWTCSPTCRYQTFQDQVAQYDAVRQRGLIPLVDWASWDFSAEPHHEQPDFTLSKIIQGDHDEYIRQWATEAKNWGHPFFLRFNWEMNVDWIGMDGYNWGQSGTNSSAGKASRKCSRRPTSD